MKPNTALTVALFAVGALCLAGGLIFLIAAVANPARWPVALVLLAAGGGLAVWAGLRRRRSQRLDPVALADEITALADRRDAEITAAEIVSDLNVPLTAAYQALARLEQRGFCHQERRGERTVYVFPGLKESRVVRRCAYCGNTYPVRDPLHKCPNCGGQLEIVKT
jgi:hypothetical protein